jgi:hypothetical protein
MPCRSLAAALGFAIACLCGLTSSAPSCSLCSNRLAPTFREEAAQSGARIILAGTLDNARLGPGGSGVTDFHITDVLRKDDWLAGKKVVELPRYLAVSDAKNPPRFLVFCDVFKDRLDPYRGVPIKSAETIEYVKKAMALDPRDRARCLSFFFNYLENSDPEVARDAFLEFAKASDLEIGAAAPKLSPERLREWLKNPQTPSDRLSLYALLLGACGGPADADLLATMLNDGNARSAEAFDGLLAGYIRMRPREGWELAITTLREGKRRQEVRIAILRTLRFYHNSQPTQSRANLVLAMAAILQQGELADVAMEDLRQWKMWDLTPVVLSLYGQKGFKSPIVQRAIIRYALSCGERDDARRFVEERRKTDPDEIQEIEEFLKPGPLPSQR